MNFIVAWPDGTRTNLYIDSMRKLDNFVGEQFARGLDVDLFPTEEGVTLFIGDPKWTAGETARAAS